VLGQARVLQHGSGMRQRARGSIFIETAFTTAAFVLLLLAVLDLGRMQYYRVSLAHAVSQAARFATTGNTLTEDDGSSMSREDAIIAKIKQLSQNLNLAPSDVDITSRDGQGVVHNGAGGPGDVVTIEVSYSVPVVAPVLRGFFPQGKYGFTCSTSFRNEEFKTT
jgi:Flp pilus assembly protein TadG